MKEWEGEVGGMWVEDGREGGNGREMGGDGRSVLR